jgi:hypothetical protein
MVPATEPVLRFVEDELGRAPALAARVHADTLQALQALQGAAAAQALAGGERALRSALYEQLAPRAAAFADAYGAALRRRVADELADGRGARAADAADGAAPARAGLTLELVDEARVEVDIEISRVAQTIDSGAEWELRELQTYTSALAGLRHVRADSLPLRPHVHAGALWDAACALSTEPALRLALLRVASPPLAAALKQAWAQASARLDAQGVTPSAYRSARLPPGSAPQRLPPPAAAAPAGSPFEALLAELAAPAGAAPAAGAAAAAGTPLPQGAQRVGLVARLFRGFAADEGLGEDLRALVAALQPPLLRLVLVDDRALHGLQHPGWALVDRIARVGDEHSGDDPRRPPLRSACAAQVAALAALDLPDAAAFGRAIAAIDAVAAALWQQRLQQAQGARDQLARLERRDALQLEAAAWLGERLATPALPAPLRRFLAGPWARVIAQAELDGGHGSAAAEQARRTVDDLLWSLDLPADAAGRRRLAARLPALLAALRAGMDAIGLPEPERAAVFDALLAVHTDLPRAAAAHGGAGAAPAPARGFADSLIDLGSLDTVPAELLPSTPDAPAAPAALAIGQSAQMFVDGRWTRVQLLWRSAQGQYLLLADDGAGRTRSMTRRAFEQLQAARLVRPAVAGSLVQRTLQRLSTQLSLQ